MINHVTFLMIIFVTMYMENYVLVNFIGNVTSQIKIV